MLLLSAKREDMWAAAQTYLFCEHARIKKADG